jgi:hypothetical protein
MAPNRRCPNCGSTRVTLERPSPYAFDWSGLSGVVLVGDGVVVSDCAECRETTTTIRNLPQLLQVIGLALVLGGPGLTGQDLAYLRSLFEISQGELAQATGRGRRETIADWEARGAAPIFRTAFEELSLRVVLMSLFQAHVVASPWCCLSARHLAQFQEATASFVARVEDRLATPAGHGPLELRRTSSTGEWRPSTSKAA